MEREDEDVSKGFEKFIDAKIENDGALQKLCDQKNVVLLAFIGSYVPRKHTPSHPVGDAIGMTDEFGMEESLKDIQNNMKKTRTRKAYLLVNSQGGGVNSSFKIAQAIRDTFDEITVFVPHIAASGGTLLALTGNRIRMGMMSQLSPVDPQLFYPDRGFVSVNSITRAKKRLEEKFEKRHKQEVGYPDKHMAEMIDPVVYEEFYGVRTASKAYLSTILRKTGYDEQAIEKISNALIFGAPKHSFVIDRNLAREIGLKVDDGNEDPSAWDLMRNWFAKYAEGETDRHFIRYCIPRN